MRGEAPWAMVSDLRALLPPEPLLRVLDEIARGEGPHVFLLAREPRLLYPLLREDKWRYEVECVDEGVRLTIFRRPRP